MLQEQLLPSAADATSYQKDRDDEKGYFSMLLSHLWLLLRKQYLCKTADMGPFLFELLSPALLVGLFEIPLFHSTMYHQHKRDCTHINHALWMLKFLPSWIINIGSVFFGTSYLTMIVFEREQKQLNGLKSMGLNEVSWYLHWVVCGFIQAFFLAICVTGIYYQTEFYGLNDMTPVFILIFLHYCQVVVFTLVLSNFCNFARNASSVLVLCVFLSSFAYVPFLSKPGSFVEMKLGLSIVPWWSLAYGCEIIKTYVLIEQQIDIHVGIGDTCHAAGGLLAIYAVQFFSLFLWLLVTAYFRCVLPNELGDHVSFNFFLKYDYWFPAQKGRSIQERYSADQKDSKYFQQKSSVNGQEVVMKVQDLVKSYSHRSGVLAVDSLSLELHKSEIYCLLGHNGAGKTTTMNMICGLLNPSGGSIDFKTNDGQWIRLDADTASTSTGIQKHLGVCPQHDIVFDNLTGRQHLELICSLKRVASRDIEFEINHRLQQCNLEAVADNAIHTYSGGMKRKISLAMALIGNPTFILLDGPTAGMDPQSRREVWSLIQESKENHAIILTTHFLDEADLLSDRIGIMSRGSLLSQGSSIFLKHAFNAGYSLIINLLEATTKESVILRAVRGFIPSASLEPNSNETAVVIHLSLKETSKFADLFDFLNANQKKLKIAEWLIELNTMDDVFIRSEALDARNEQQNVEVDVDAVIEEGVEHLGVDFDALSQRRASGHAWLQLKCIVWSRWVTQIRKWQLLVFCSGLPLVLVFVGFLISHVTSGDLSDMFVPMFIGMAYQQVGLGGGVSLVIERATGVRHKLFLMGINSRLYYFGNFVFDAATVLPSFAITLLSIYLFHQHGLMNNHLYGFVLLTVTFCTSGIPCYYLMAMLFSTEQQATGIFPLFTNALTILPFIVVQSFTMNGGHEELMSILTKCFNVIPTFALQNGADKLMALDVDASLTEMLSFNDEGIGLVLLMNVCCSLLFSGMLLIIEFLRHYRAETVQSARALARSLSLSSIDDHGVDEDGDVVHERTEALALIDQQVQGSIAVVDLRMEYNSKHQLRPKLAVKNLSLAVKPGELFVLLGPNGAGKTSTLNCLTAEQNPTSGTAYLNGYHLGTELDKVYAITGYCEQFDASLFQVLTVKEHLQFYSQIKLLEPRCSSILVNYLINTLGLSPYADVLAMNLSGGNKRKLSVAIALVGIPRCSFFDEPSTGIDPSSRRQLYSVLKNKVFLKNRCIWLTTHLMEEAEFLASRIGIMTKGELRCIGSSTRLKSKFGNYNILELSIDEPGDDIAMDQYVATFKSNIESMFPGQPFTLIEQVGLNFKYKLESRNQHINESLSAVFRTIEAKKQKLNIIYFTLCPTTLEQLFLRFAEEAPMHR